MEASQKRDMDPRDPHGKIAHEFDCIDLNKDGFLSEDELFQGLCKRGYEQDELQDLFARLDTDMDGRISRNEFLEGMLKGVYSPPLSRETIEFEHGLRRMGINRPDNILALKEQWASVDQALAPMRVVRYSDMEKHGKLPRSSDGITIPLSEVGEDEHIVFCSHNWKRGDEEQCKSNGHVWEGAAHPDDERATKHKLLCAGVANLAKEKGWSLDKVLLWLDFCGIDQDDDVKKWAGVQSLRGYLSVCDAVIIPYPEPPSADASRSVDALKVYGERGWTRLEALVVYGVGILKGSPAPELWVTWDDVAGKAGGDAGSTRLEQFEFSLDADHLPASETSIMKNEADRPAIKVHQDKLLDEIKASVARQGYISKHAGSVYCVAIHPKDARIVASCGDDAAIKIVNRETGIVKCTLKSHSGWVQSIAWSPDGNLLASGSGDETVKIWELRGGAHSTFELKHTLEHHSDYVNCVAFSPDGSRLASAGEDGKVHVFDAKTFEVMGSCDGHSEAVVSVAWSHDSKRLASCSHDKTVKVWDAATFESETLAGHSDSVKCVAFSPDGTRLASGGGDLTIQVWDLQKKEVVGMLEEEGAFSKRSHSEDVLCVAFSPDGKLLASAGKEGMVKLWDADSLRIRQKLEHSSAVYSVSWSHGSNLIASGSGDHTVKIWDAVSVDKKKTRPPDQHIGWVDFVAFSPDNDAMVASSSHDKTIKIWDASTQLCQQVLVEHSGWVYSVSWSPDSRLLASASKDMQGGGGGEIIIWDVKPSFQVKRKLRGHSQGVISVAWSPGPDNKYLASGGYDSTIKVWDAKTFEEKFSFEGHSREINVLAWSRNGTRLASGSGDKTIKIWDVAKQTLLGTLEGHTGWVLSMRWSPDGRFLASGSGDRTVKIWDAMKTYCLECSFEGDKVTWQEPSSAQASRSDFVVVALGDQLVVHRFCPATQGGSASKPTCLRLASTRCPSSVISVCSRGTSVVAGCSDGQVLFLDAPVMMQPKSGA